VPPWIELQRLGNRLTGALGPIRLMPNSTEGRDASLLPSPTASSCYTANSFAMCSWALCAKNCLF
jgi:hypothetical protein